MKATTRATDYRVGNIVTVHDSESMHYLLTGIVTRIHVTRDGEILYDVCLPHRSGAGADCWLLKSNQLYNAAKF